MMGTVPHTSETPKMRDDSYITKTSVLERPGWSAALVKNLLGEPDMRKKMHGHSALLALYARDRVEAAEASHEFQIAQGALAKRKAAANKAVITKTENLLEAVKATTVSVVQWDIKRVRKAAIDSYNSWHEGARFASHRDDPAFLDRITVNFIRHELTKYDKVLYDIMGKTGVAKAKLEIRELIFAAIEKAYPALSKECRRQLEEHE